MKSAGLTPCVARWPSLTPLALAWLLLAPRPAPAAFELRDAGPAALGAASLDVVAAPWFEPVHGGLAVSVSHASLYQAEGLTSERVTAALDHRALRASASWNQLGFPGAREHTLRVALEELGKRPIALSVVGERLALAVQGEPARGGLALGASVSARVLLPRGTIECTVTGDRLLRSRGLAPLGVGASFPFALRLRARGVALGWVDRWEASGAASPRLVLDLALGRSASVRIARGMAPARSGAALAVRKGRVELAVARLDQDAGGSVSSVSVGFAMEARRALGADR